MAEMATEQRKNVVILDTEEHVAVALAKYTARLSDRFVGEKGSFTVVLTGGSLIDTLRKLVEPPYIDSIDWSKWFIFWADERVVPLDDPESNYKLAYDGFLSKVPIPSDNIFAINDTLSPEGAADDYEARLKGLVEKGILGLSEATGFPQFDLILLGMGPEGHVCSLFPWHFQRYEKQRWVTFLTDAPKPPPKRITFTFPVVNSSSEIALVVTGSEVAYAANVALRETLHSCQFIPLSVQMVSPEGNLIWFLDKDAASKLVPVPRHFRDSYA